MGRQVKIKSLPKGFKLKDNKVIKVDGGKTGDQVGLGLTTFPKTSDPNGMGDSTGALQISLYFICIRIIYIFRY